jgi:hypothetical protein
MMSCEKTKHLPKFFWEPLNINIRSINREALKINRYAPHFPILINGHSCLVTYFNTILLLTFFLVKTLFIDISHLPLEKLVSN